MRHAIRALIPTAALACAFLAAAEPAVQPTIIELSLKAREARLAGDHAAWLEHGRATLARAPDHPDLLVSVARASAATGDEEGALRLLGEAVARGARIDASAVPEFGPLAGDARFQALAEAGRRNLAPVSPPEVFLVIENTDIQPEGITYDPDSGRLFIGSLGGEIWQFGMDRRLERFAGPDAGLREVLGLKVDRSRRLLWAVTGVFPDLFPGEPKKDVGLTGVLAFDLRGGERVRECWLDARPAQHGFNDLALAQGGDVYVSDSITGSIWRLPGGECRLERVIQDAAMGFPNGIALSRDEKRLYVAHIEGLSVVDLDSGRRTLLPVPADAAVNSMDGLVREGDDLLGVQPSPYLARVARIRLTEDGNAVREVATMSSPPPPGVSQATGVVVGTHYYSVAGALDPLATGGEPDRRARILRTTLR